MSTSSQTPRPGFGRYATLAEQTSAFEALDVLASACPDLPPVYLTVHASSFSGVIAQCNTVADFESWRSALQIPTSEVDLIVDGQGGWLAAEATVRGVRLRITGHGLLIAQEQAAPQIKVTTLAKSVNA
ncbi:hypothetical protein CG717_16385 [Streptomyces sp. CB02613]|uniref:hypothetical protein n=1 Tax=Streptomyces sp. CB02613 TaxID=2020328 RepID=UPI000C27F7E3|nr:hypothetical protein [Streptomyces sp. CB02613]PJN31341.1 hypothetical protein CG717_16385 [Streptomyces sp. CB02613]